MCQLSRATISRFSSETQWQMLMILYGRHVWVTSLQGTTKMGNTLLQITRERETAETWFLARLFIYQSSIVFQVLDLIHWMVPISLLIAWLVKTENYIFLCEIGCFICSFYYLFGWGLSIRNYYTLLGVLLIGEKEKEIWFHLYMVRALHWTEFKDTIVLGWLRFVFCPIHFENGIEGFFWGHIMAFVIVNFFGMR